MFSAIVHVEITFFLFGMIVGPYSGIDVFMNGEWFFLFIQRVFNITSNQENKPIILDLLLVLLILLPYPRPNPFNLFIE